jgi:hypothetical protein
MLPECVNVIAICQPQLTELQLQRAGTTALDHSQRREENGDEPSDTASNIL